MPTRLLRRFAVLIAASSFVVVGCGGGGDDAAAPTTSAGETSTTSAPESETTTTGAAAIADPDDDTNGDGVLDPFCGEQDFGAGLVLQIHCDLEGLSGEVPPGVTLVEASLFALRSSIHRSLDGISGNLIVSRDPDGNRVFVIVFQSDALFATGSASIETTESFDNVAALVDSEFPGSLIQVRGHTDSTGDTASNQSLSEQRAEAVQARFLELGIDSPEVTAVGFGETSPMAVEDTDEGRAFNRRVEVVIRPPSG